jgi:hypothetical protein
MTQDIESNEREIEKNIRLFASKLECDQMSFVRDVVGWLIEEHGRDPIYITDFEENDIGVTLGVGSRRIPLESLRDDPIVVESLEDHHKSLLESLSSWMNREEEIDPLDVTDIMGEGIEILLDIRGVPPVPLSHFSKM